MSDLSNTHEKKRSTKVQRVITGAVLVVLLAAVLAIGGWFFAIVAFIALSLALHEEFSALRSGGHRPVSWTSYIGLGISIPLMMQYSSLVMIPILTLLSFAILLQVMRRDNPDLVDIMTSVLPMLTIVLPGMCLFGILDTDPRSMQTMLLIMVFAIAVGGDTFAYFVGSALRGPKLCPHISPNKTISGAIGGLCGSIFCAVLVGRIFSWAIPSFAGPPIWGDILVGLFGGVAGQMGDLFASLVKRHCNVKDFGHIFPGHGGMLDRLDSIVFTAIIVYCYRVILLASF
ncbi:MAG: phosphatidate cytidylyltransferase [Clostridiales bacterium]|nr:phosphatidate cytidylyltransferase [Clostridiales bacterium]